MAMKKTDLEKNKALKLNNAMKQSTAERFGKAAAAAPKIDRREQRKLDQAQGLVPFACKLNGDLVAQLKERAAKHPDGMTGLLNEVITRGLAQ
ncbi:hypothetical protein EN871_11390 [bacterium M00.F.Ca.ET.228.01.1.1]|uniref:hypothetical protein n=1 Tax=Paraburkholderia phenoliruptrix TaxID=252970 RepID=UPI001091AE9B|nr:hypothetical protein [Paraburkholderia phenoliruptrix]MBW9131076.1 hypothetical protein [Paraburkholderia ginsengiterrae]TGP45162.1 hypothetical protein EN871_11390 [bacterium M00.F.Ca.ET.228.01.1.1]TGS03045.1 hypothetical protein EN834_11385 [bacterium M00.F.Ca.ET.191.01.1.1]TGU06427.1 hypothetical protein EN798_15465 [bacterium M00.F.Ca.ET.155.01.1.1]MBW0448780.1 hypothetical protein [Paraburkholderia phenoliruptrix]